MGRIAAIILIGLLAFVPAWAADDELDDAPKDAPGTIGDHIDWGAVFEGKSVLDEDEDMSSVLNRPPRKKVIWRQYNENASEGLPSEPPERSRMRPVWAGQASRLAREARAGGEAEPSEPAEDRTAPGQMRIDRETGEIPATEQPETGRVALRRENKPAAPRAAGKADETEPASVTKAAPPAPGAATASTGKAPEASEAPEMRYKVQTRTRSEEQPEIAPKEQPRIPEPEDKALGVAPPEPAQPAEPMDKESLAQGPEIKATEEEPPAEKTAQVETPAVETLKIEPPKVEPIKVEPPAVSTAEPKRPKKQPVETEISESPKPEAAPLPEDAEQQTAPGPAPRVESVEVVPAPEAAAIPEPAPEVRPAEAASESAPEATPEAEPLGRSMASLEPRQPHVRPKPEKPEPKRLFSDETVERFMKLAFYDSDEQAAHRKGGATPRATVLTKWKRDVLVVIRSQAGEDERSMIADVIREIDKVVSAGSAVNVRMAEGKADVKVYFLPARVGEELSGYVKNKYDGAEIVASQVVFYTGLAGKADMMRLFLRVMGLPGSIQDGDKSLLSDGPAELEDGGLPAVDKEALRMLYRSEFPPGTDMEEVRRRLTAAY